MLHIQSEQKQKPDFSILEVIFWEAVQRSLQTLVTENLPGSSYLQEHRLS